MSYYIYLYINKDQNNIICVQKTYGFIPVIFFPINIWNFQKKISNNFYEIIPEMCKLDKWKYKLQKKYYIL